jgi:hypothetical protein
MEREGSLPCSQKHANACYSGPVESNPYLILFDLDHYHPPMKAEIFLEGFPTLTLHLSPREFYIPRPSHPPWLGPPNTIWWREQLMKPITFQFHHPTVTSYLLSPQNSGLKYPCLRLLVRGLLIALMMEAASTSETSVKFYQTSRRNNPEDSQASSPLIYV